MPLMNEILMALFRKTFMEREEVQKGKVRNVWTKKKLVVMIFDKLILEVTFYFLYNSLKTFSFIIKFKLI